MDGARDVGGPCATTPVPYAGVTTPKPLKKTMAIEPATLADGILDRLVHNAHRIEMRRASMRNNRGQPNA
jgi:hypothetical protein